MGYKIVHAGAFGQPIEVVFKNKKRANSYYSSLKKKGIKSAYVRLRK